MSFVITIDTADTLKLVEGVAQAADAIATGAARALNLVATTARIESVKRVFSQVNLSESYINGHIEFRDADQAKESSLKAVIRAAQDPTRLDRFVTTHPVTVSNVWTKAKFEAAFGVGAWVRPNKNARGALPWRDRKGNPHAGVPAGQKLAGVHANVGKGRPGGTISYAFYAPMRAGKIAGGNGMGIFKRRPGSKKLTPIYGPSVDQALKRVWSDMEPDTTEQLSKAVLEQVGTEVDRMLKTK